MRVLSIGVATAAVLVVSAWGSSQSDTTLRLQARALGKGHPAVLLGGGLLGADGWGTVPAGPVDLALSTYDPASFIELSRDLPVRLWTTAKLTTNNCTDAHEMASGGALVIQRASGQVRSGGEAL